MKSFNFLKLLVCFCLFVISRITAQSDQAILVKAYQFIKDRKFYSAFKLLSKHDINNLKADFVLLKTDLVIHYSSQSYKNQFYTLVDNDGIIPSDLEHTLVCMYKADSFLLNLISKEPNNCNLYKRLSEYYFKHLTEIGFEWIVSKEKIIESIRTNLEKVNQSSCQNFYTYYMLGYIARLEFNYKESIPYFLKSLSAKKDFGYSYYYLASSYFQQEQFDSAIY